MKNLSKRVIVLSILVNLVLGSLLFMGFKSATPSTWQTPSSYSKVHNGNGFEVYRIIDKGTSIYVVKSTDNYSVSISTK
jgi:hypothetical protein